MIQCFNKMELLATLLNVLDSFKIKNFLKDGSEGVNHFFSLHVRTHTHISALYVPCCIVSVTRCLALSLGLAGLSWPLTTCTSLHPSCTLCTQHIKLTDKVFFVHTTRGCSPRYKISAVFAPNN